MCLYIKTMTCCLRPLDYPSCVASIKPQRREMYCGQRRLHFSASVFSACCRVEKPWLLLLFKKKIKIKDYFPVLVSTFPCFQSLCLLGSSGAQRLSFSSGQSPLLFSPFKFKKDLYLLPQYSCNELDVKGPSLLSVFCCVQEEGTSERGAQDNPKSLT